MKRVVLCTVALLIAFSTVHAEEKPAVDVKTIVSGPLLLGIQPAEEPASARSDWIMLRFEPSPCGSWQSTQIGSKAHGV